MNLIESLQDENQLLHWRIKSSSAEKNKCVPQHLTDPGSKESVLTTPTTLIATIGTITILQHKGKGKD